MKRIALFAASAALVTSAWASALVVHNQSLWDIHHLYLSSSDSEQWGPDQLGSDVLESGQTLTLTGVECDTYDVKVVDEDGDECELRGVELCGDASWTIDNDELLGCENQ